MRRTSCAKIPGHGGTDTRRPPAGAGEGWQWPRIASDACPQCGMHAAALPASRSVRCSWSRSPPGRSSWPPPTSRSSAPIPGPGCSPPSHTACTSATSRGYTATACPRSRRTTPRCPPFIRPKTRWEALQHVGPGVLATDLEAQADRLASILDALEDVVVADADRWYRRGTDRVYRFTVAGCTPARCTRHTTISSMPTGRSRSAAGRRRSSGAARREDPRSPARPGRSASHRAGSRRHNEVWGVGAARGPGAARPG